MQQAKRLVGARVHRHLRFQRVVTDAGIDNAEMRHHCVQAGGVQRLKR